MKRAYSAPDIFFDSFALNENIASANANCTRNITNAYQGTCALIFGGRNVFTSAYAVCDFTVEDGSPLFDGGCYGVPTADNKLFNS